MKMLLIVNLVAQISNLLDKIHEKNFESNYI